MSEAGSSWRYVRAPLQLPCNRPPDRIEIDRLNRIDRPTAFSKNPETPIIVSTTTTTNQVPHVTQEGTWDCGVACVQMALTYAYQLQPPPPRPEGEGKGEKEEEREEEIRRAALLARVGTESIWTIDLLFLLQVRDDGWVGV
jgi:hypothetical protein